VLCLIVGIDLLRHFGLFPRGVHRRQTEMRCEDVDFVSLLQELENHLCH